MLFINWYEHTVQCSVHALFMPPCGSPKQLGKRRWRQERAGQRRGGDVDEADALHARVQPALQTCRLSRQPNLHTGEVVVTVGWWPLPNMNGNATAAHTATVTRQPGVGSVTVSPPCRGADA